MQYLEEEYLDDLRTHLTEFIDDLTENIFTDGVENIDFTIVKVWLMTTSDQDLMKHIIDRVLPFENHIINKDRLFFEGEAGKIFGELGNEKVNMYMAKLGNPNFLSEEEQEHMWEYFIVMVKMANRYKSDILSNK